MRATSVLAVVTAGCVAACESNPAAPTPSVSYVGTSIIIAEQTRTVCILATVPKALNDATHFSAMMTADSLATTTPWGDTVGWVTESHHLGTWRLTATNQPDIAGPCDLIEHAVWETLDLVRAAGGWRGTQRTLWELQSLARQPVGDTVLETSAVYLTRQ